VEAKQRIDAILAGPDFHKIVTSTSLHRKGAKEEEIDNTVPEWFIRFVEWWEKHGDTSGVKDFFNNTAAVIRFALWVVVISLFIFLLYRYRDSLRYWTRRRAPKTAAPPPEILFGLDVRSASLPPDVIAEVLALWQAQQPRAALGLLYRATLANLLQRFALPFHDDHTEAECAAITTAATPHPVANYFSELTRVWQQLAYAHRNPDTAQLEQL
jgi:hypothetical protein